MGPVCHIKCDYRFYREPRALFGQREDYRMPDEVLAAHTAQYVRSQPTPVVEFVWHGGSQRSGLSLDGPREIHDRYRKGRHDESTFAPYYATAAERTLGGLTQFGFPGSSTRRKR